jgi:hypothetical protein
MSDTRKSPSRKTGHYQRFKIEGLEYADYIFDGGGVVHCPILGADFGCSNLECARYKDLTPG